jgi:hypothetical protein
VAQVIDEMYPDRTEKTKAARRGLIEGIPNVKPLPNVWLGVSVENQPAADERIPLLLRTPAAVRFISGEPLLGLVSLEHCIVEHHASCDAAGRRHSYLRLAPSPPGLRLGLLSLRPLRGFYCGEAPFRGRPQSRVCGRVPR